MKISNKFPLAILCVAMMLNISSCDKTEDEKKQDVEAGQLSILLDNKLGQKGIILREPGDDTYDYVESPDQSYNISTFAYYISAIELEGPNGTKHVDPLNVSADADEVTGYYHVTSTTPNSNLINLTGIEAGSYDKIRFTVGVAEEGVQAGAAGGVLDPAEGAWFWNWNAGYIGFGVEGTASNSGQGYVDCGNGVETLAGTFAIHIGGWKDVEPEEGEDPKFVNNLKILEFDFDSEIDIEKGLTPNVHMNVNFEELFKGNDFSTTYAAHRPDLSKPFAEKLVNVFELDHVHQ